jgi:hypothetical protein
VYDEYEDSNVESCKDILLSSIYVDEIVVPNLFEDQTMDEVRHNSSLLFTKVYNKNHLFMMILMHMIFKTHPLQFQLKKI